jgi:phosphonate transport system substrate-binding protein
MATNTTTCSARPSEKAVRSSWLPWAGVLAGLALTVSCRSSWKTHAQPALYAERGDTSAEPVYLFSSHPHVTEQRVFELFAPLVDRFNQQCHGVRFKLETAPDYSTYEARLYARRYDFSLANPLQTLEATHHGYTVFGKVANDAQFAGIVLARKGHVPTKVTDLKGWKVAYPAATAVAACMLPQLFFAQHGLDVNRDIENIFTGNQESSINAVAIGISDLGVTWAPPWEVYQRTRPDSAAKLEVVWTTPPLVNNGLVVRDDVPEAIREQVARILFALPSDTEGRKLLAAMAYAGFEPATLATYAPVAEFLEYFSKRVRPLEREP